MSQEFPDYRVIALILTYGDLRTNVVYEGSSREDAQKAALNTTGNTNSVAALVPYRWLGSGHHPMGESDQTFYWNGDKVSLGCYHRQRTHLIEQAS